MKRIIFGAVAAAALAAAPAHAALIYEVAEENNVVRAIEPAPRVERGAGNIVTSEYDGRSEPAKLDGLRQVPYPASERPAFDRGQ